MGDEERAKRVREHYWKRDEKYRRGPSSEDVWVARKELLPKDAEEGRFEGDWEAMDKAEWEEMIRLAERIKPKGTKKSLYGAAWSDGEG